jgi:hypothetical protein
MIKNLNVFLKTGLLFFILIIGLDGYSQKDDTLYFRNGDRISGEIRQYKYGYLTYKTYGVSTVKVKYEKISTFYSNKSFEILLSNGRRWFGSFDTSNMEQYINIVTLNDTTLTPLIEVVEFIPIKNGFWRKLTGNVDVGYSFAKANSLSQLSGGTDIRYIQRSYQMSLKGNALVTSQEEAADIKKNDLTMAYFKRLGKTWFAGTALGGEQNSELGLELRVQASFVGGNEVIHTNSNNLMAFAGFVVNQEFNTDTTLSTWNFDGVATLSYRLFRFQDPEINITSNLTAYPSFTVPGRYRIDMNISAKVTIISDMYFKLSFYDNYDSKPASETASNNDYRITTSIGYSF